MAANRTADPGEAARRLAAGAVVLMRTDTLPGLHCRADAAAAVARIDALKGRDAQKPLLVLCADVDSAFALSGDLDDRARAYARGCWPGPFTLVLPAGRRAPDGATRGGGTVAVRVPEPPDLRTLIAAAGGPLVSTSANRAGEPAPTDLAAAAAAVGSGADLVLTADWTGADPHDTAASALVSLAEWPPRLLRPGPRVPPSLAEGGEKP